MSEIDILNQNILLPIETIESELWMDTEPFDKRSAWVDLLLSANESRTILLGNELVTVERGTFITSIRKLCDKWKWSNTKVTSYLKLMKTLGMINYTSDNKKTVISIENQGVYQGVNDTETTHKRQEKDSETSPRKGSSAYSAENNEYKLAAYLFNHIKKNNPKAKEPNYQSWCKQFDSILRIDERDLEEVKKVIQFALTDSFWYKNILSPEKLRKQYDRLVTQMNEKKSSPKQQQQYGKKNDFNNYPQRDYDYDDLEKKLLGSGVVSNTDEEVEEEPYDFKAKLAEFRKGANVTM